jgi:hypothetical protein
MMLYSAGQPELTTRQGEPPSLNRTTHFDSADTILAPLSDLINLATEPSPSPPPFVYRHDSRVA